MKHSLVLILSLLYAGHGAAQSAGGTAAFTDIATDARSAAMGGATVSARADAWSIFHNGAQMPFADMKGGVAYSYMPWMRSLVAGSVYQSAAGFYRIGERHAVSAGFRHLKHSGTQTMDEQGNAGAVITPKDMSFDAAYAYRIIPKLSASLTARYIDSDLGYVPASGTLAFDLGLVFRDRLSPNGSLWSLGVQAANFGGKMKVGDARHELLRKITAGGSVDILLGERHRLGGNLDAIYYIPAPDGAFFDGAVGGEYIYNGLAALRGGYRFGNKDKGAYSYGTMGVGVIFRHIRLDAAWWLTPADCPYRNTWTLTLGVDMGLLRRQH